MNKDAILIKADQIHEELISIRRDIHAHPEVGFNEHRTAALVAEKLKAQGLQVETNIGITGVVGILKGKQQGKTLLIRADMDCLELEELNEVEYKSKFKGLMHGCGHDAHTTMLLGAAMILSGYKDQIKGNIKFIFQPAEEVNGGAKKMVEDGVLKNPPVDAVMGIHIWPTIEAGKMGVRYGALCAAPDRFKITITGKGGHGAQPDQCVDPINIACQVYMALQTIISRRINPLDPALLTIGKFHSGTAFNIIPDKVEMEGTVRTLDKELRKTIPKLMESVIKGISDSAGGTFDLDYIPYYPPLINDIGVTDIVEKAGEEVLGKENVVRIENPTMGGEDFAYFQEDIPGSFFIIGTQNKEKGIDSPLHSARFNIDEDILHKGAAVIAKSAINYLHSK